VKKFRTAFQIFLVVRDLASALRAKSLLSDECSEVEKSNIDLRAKLAAAMIRIEDFSKSCGVEDGQLVFYADKTAKLQKQISTLIGEKGALMAQNERIKEELVMIKKQQQQHKIINKNDDDNVAKKNQDLETVRGKVLIFYYRL
jgi:hypothetical protein